jgi:hypothetical protein
MVFPPVSYSNQLEMIKSNDVFSIPFTIRYDREKRNLAGIG